MTEQPNGGTATEEPTRSAATEAEPLPGEYPATDTGPNGIWPKDLRHVGDALEAVGLGDTALADPEWWRTIDAWVESHGVEVYVLTELKNYAAWRASQSGRKKHRDLKRGFRNWLSTAIRWKERESQRQAQRDRYSR